MVRCFLRLDVFFFDAACLFLFLFFAIRISRFLHYCLGGLVDDPHRARLRPLEALLLVPLYTRADL